MQGINEKDLYKLNRVISITTTSHTPQAYCLAFLAIISTQFNASIKSIQTDGSGQFIVLQTLLLKHCIAHCFTYLYASKQNEVLEACIEEL